MSYRTANYIDVNPGQRGVTLKAFTDLHLVEVLQDPALGAAFDLGLGGVPTLAANASAQGYAFPADTGSTVAVAIGDTRAGCLALSTDGTDNDTAVLKKADFPVRFGADAGGSFAIAARVALSSVSNTNFLFGFAASAATTAILGATGTLGSEDFVGFQITEGADTTLRIVHKDGATAVVVDEASAATVAADTFINLAIRYDHEAGTILYYVDNALVATVSAATIEAAGFPDDADLVPVLVLANGSAATRTLTASAFRGVRAID